MGVELRVVHGDITEVGVDAIVNAANSSLLGGGGVDGAIHRAAGPDLLAECRQLVTERGPCEPGDAVMTGAGDLAVRSVIRAVIHTVGPIWPQNLPDSDAGELGDELDDTLGSCYRTSLDLAAQAGYRSVAFPNVSTGVYGFPKARAASVALQAVATALAVPSAIDEVLFVCFDDENVELYRDRLEA